MLCQGSMTVERFDQGGDVDHSNAEAVCELFDRPPHRALPPRLDFGDPSPRKPSAIRKLFLAQLSPLPQLPDRTAEGGLRFRCFGHTR